MKKKRYLSIKVIILVPVFILGLVCILSNFMAISSLRSVNANASEIQDEVHADKIEIGSVDGFTKEWNINGENVTLAVKKL